MNHQHRRTQVLISGAGPVGLAAAVELGLRGVECLVVEPRLQPTRSRPRAKTLNTRTLEHLRRWGLAERLRALAPLPTWWSQDVSFCTTLLGPEITRFSGVLGLTDTGVSPELGQQLPQYVLEEMLREVVAEIPSCTLLLGHRVSLLVDCGDAVEVQIETTSAADRETVVAQYVLGADGARGIVREAIGAHYQGTQALRPNFGVVFRSEGLLDALPNPPAVQSWVVNDRTPAVMGPVDRLDTWWLIAFGVEQPRGDHDLQSLVRGAVGDVGPVEILSTDPWTARMELVDHCRAGRVFLIGDAAHLNPPFGGHGLNTGIGDAVDIGWKLAACIHGWGGPALLNSYQDERRPLHQRVIDEAKANMSVLSNDLHSAGLDEGGDQGEQARSAAAVTIRETKTAEYFSLDLVLGHRYTGSPIISNSARQDSEHPGRAGDWRGAAVPGVRVPHACTGPGESTLDLAGPGFAVLTSTPDLVEPLQREAEHRGIPLQVHQLDPELQSSVLGAEIVLLRPDQVVAWCGDLAPNSGELLDLVTGALSTTEPCDETNMREQGRVHPDRHGGYSSPAVAHEPEHSTTTWDSGGTPAARPCAS